LNGRATCFRGCPDMRLVCKRAAVRLLRSEDHLVAYDAKSAYLHEDRPVEERVELSDRTCGRAFEQRHCDGNSAIEFANLDHALMNFVVLVNHDPEATPRCWPSCLPSGHRLQNVACRPSARHGPWRRYRIFAAESTFACGSMAYPTFP